MATKISTDLLAQLMASLQASPEAIVPTEKPEEAPVTFTTSTLPAFSIKGAIVPALECADISLDVAVSGKVRSPYNSGLYRLGKPILQVGATLRQVIQTHVELQALGTPVEDAPVVRAAPAKSAKAKTAKPTAERNVAFTKANGEVVYGTAKQVAAWTTGAERLKAQAKKQPVATIAPDLQAILSNPDVIAALKQLVGA